MLALLALVMFARVIQPKNNLTDRIYNNRNADPNKKFCPAVHVISSFCFVVLSFDGLSIADYHCNDYKNAYLRDIMPANHMINIINYNDTRYGFDAYNHRVYRFLNEFELEDIETNQRLLFKFYSQLKYNGDYNYIII